MGRTVKKSGWVFLFTFTMVLCLAVLPKLADAVPPTSATVVGDMVTNPMTGLDVEVVELIYDPDEAPTDPSELAFVKTEDGYLILVKKTVDDVIYMHDEEKGLSTATVVASDSTAKTVDLQAADGEIRIMDYAFTPPEDTPGEDVPPIFDAGADGVRTVKKGRGGSNGHDGALFVRPAAGGNGATGPTVSYSNDINISATDKPGIEAGSVGGNGGSGGDSYASFWSGRAGGNGGAGGIVTVINPEGFQVVTTGNNAAYGIFAFSRSGNGGTGGSGYGAPGGGTGGGVSSGGTVTAKNYGVITTTGQGAHGIYGLSTGGSAGSGGDNWGIVGSGGSGAAGGKGGAVNLTNDGTIHTYGDGAHGMLAQSIGGTGGDGGDAAGIVAFGGGAKTGGEGGNVSITTNSNSNIITKGNYSVGILAQSIGGGGGDSGASGGIVALGASGGSGNVAGSVTITNNAGSFIKTEGIGAYGVLGQSVGGGGGNSRATGGAVSLGGSGATGGHGDTVTIDSAADIETGGAYAHAIFGQSVGGGGGSAGGGGGLVSLGGAGGGGGDGEAVQVTNRGMISTTGVDARGIFAQSIGGGGGSGGATGGLVALGGGGSAGGGSGAVTVINMFGGDTCTEKDGSDAIFAQSVGGGGGSGASSGGLVSLGGKGSSGGLGGVVSVTNDGILETEGDWARGIFAQSVGGGGGSGGDSGGLVSIGGSSDTGSDASDVIVTSNGAVTTSGANSAAVYAQSVGGGGGSGGSSGGAITLGGSGSGGGLGGAVTVNTIGMINTTGNKSAGVFAQSVGGGGGDGGTSYGVVTIGGSGGPGNDGGIVSAAHGGVIHTRGEDSFGIFAQSVGGGGGNGGASYSGGLFAGFSLGGDGDSGGRGGMVNVDLDTYLLDGDQVASFVTTEKDRATGIFAQSVGGGGGNGGNAIQGTVGTGVSLSVAIGGKGASGGDGGTVDLTGNSDVLTLGNHAGGVVLQSVGGGGGNGGTAVSASASIGDGVAIGVAIGGDGGTGGKGGEVTADVDSIIETRGEFSTGFLAQSIGGGGGNGGTTVAATAAGGAVGAAAISVGVGGDAGDGGIGDHVDVTLEGSVLTRNAQSDGVVIQSVGGGGGNGGVTVAAGAAGAGTGSANVTVGVGGSGGGGGNAGQVDANLDSDVETLGDGSDGVVVQSIGGGGGNSGLTVSAGLSGAGVGAGGINVGVGGSGGLGGNGDVVDADYSGTLITRGDNATGLLAQSVGGGGGNSSGTIAASLNGAGTGSGSVSVGIGGAGGGAGNGGRDGIETAVTLKTAGSVLTFGDHSSGVIAQSIGGGGGNGGYSIAASLSGAGTGSGTVSVGVGGGAGSGGDGKGVVADLCSGIWTKGSDSTGALIQSVGGGGGNGGFSVSAAISGAGTGNGSAAVGVGGSGGSGGVSSTVKSTLIGDVTTDGKNATAVIAQSIGGGGGSGGMTIAGAISGAGTGSGAASVSVGGSGGGGGNSNTVDNMVAGNIVTAESGSGGVLAQSVGGGGGNGGISVSGTISVAGTGSGAVSVGIGGSGGDGGDSRKVTNTLTGTVYTSGSDASGIVAQSLGGGGGNGGINVTGTIAAAKTGAGAVGLGVGGSGGGGGDAGDVENTVEGYVQTLRDNSTGILAQSLGGGGGNGGLNVTGIITGAKTGSGGLAVGVGGFGGDGGDGADVTNTVTGGTVTTGNNADGIVTQSLGGGGGNGAINVTGSLNFSKENGGTLGVGIGGFGGNGGDAGDVTSTVTTTAEYNQIGTTGNDSSAVIAQSIGGGGGNGGLNITGAVNASGKNGAAIGVGVGGFGGGAGDAGSVSLGVTGPVVTEGNNSHGLIAQSIGGGGGNGGTNITGSLAITKPASGSSSMTVAASIGVGGFGGGGGKADNVDVTYAGTIVAQPRDKEGAGSHGILAQSLGGGGGNGGINVSAGISYAAGDSDGHALLVGIGGFSGTGGSAGSVDVTVGGGESVSAYGAGSSAIMAQSAGGGGGNGGINVSGGIVSDSPLIVGVGGMGGNGGVGDNVNVNATTDVYASAADSKDLNSAGIFAQTLGGGGGNGGINVSGGISLSKEKGVPSITVGVGGFGGAGAISGNTDVNHIGTAITSGDWIHGIMAQSIAGGGGNGALNVSGQLNWADSENSGGKTDLSIVAGIGGHGGAGADAGDVSVTSTGTITTSGENARGIFAQTIGGGGGNGGMNVTGVFAKNSSPVSVGIGGFGSGGGDAGAVNVARGSTGASAGKITTSGTGAIGIEASSIGGGGGDAGMNFIVGISLAGSGSDDGGTDGGGSTRNHPKNTGVDDSVFTNYDAVLDQLEGKAPTDDQDSTDANKESAFAAQIAIGGAGGVAGHGGASSVDNVGDVETRKNNSHGIMAQSIGGGGGNASFNLAVTYQGKSDKNKGFNLAIGGAPGDGGNGSTVDVTHDGSIETFGNNSYGILSQSIGGGGGNAGLDVAYSKTDGGKVGITLGRRGGTGGFGGDVTLSSKGSVMTHGSNSFGLLAQSIGNGGGNSSSTSVSLSVPEEGDTPARAASVSVGLEGGVGGIGGDVTLAAEGSVSTDGENAHAIFAQSVGGGGGNGGSASGVAVLSSTAALAIGGTGGEGGIGGTVNVTSSADVRTNNTDSIGILAQSVGGGGGTGGAVRSGGLQTKGSGALVSVGGSGGVGMAGGAVTVGNSGVVITDGKNSHGVLAQSLGGGGGNAGMVINAIYNKDASNATQISVSLGGSGGDGAVSSDVTVVNTGGIGTNQENSIGVFAQSIGGGGGNANTVVTGSLSGNGAGNKVSLGIGGSGGTGAAAGNVTISNLKGVDVDSGKIITLGNYSHGILAMSVGGGGGSGSTTITSNKSSGLPATSTSKSVAFSLGGAGGEGGTGGEVVVTNSGEITTYGYKAHGVVAQSVGGGGGSGGMSIAGDLSMGATTTQDSTNKTSTISVGGFGGSGNISGDVTVNNSGSIEVFGNKSYGIYAQSVGGGGGDGGFSSTLSRNLITNPKTNLQASLMNIGMGGNGGDGADSGDVLVEHTGSITAHGDNSYGVFAQSIGGGGGNVGSSITCPAWMAVDYTVSTLLGGRDGSTGTAGTVTINTTGDITMLGANSQAQFAQSVNGGGGNIDLFLDVSQQAVELGDDGFELPDNGGDVDKAMAFVTQYIELGTTEIVGATGSAIDATHVGDLHTWAEKSVASFTQSVGGGGGNADADVVVNDEADVNLILTLGAKETNNSSGGDITLSRTGNVCTAGRQSQGVSVQSVGGGGGRILVDVNTVSAQDSQLPGQPNSSATVVLGADPSFDNHGGVLDLNLRGNTVTSGDYSPGLVLQSIGAGGGQTYLSGLASVSIDIGASDGSTGNGGDIQVSNTGAIVTSGELSDGIVLQSIGGGGGYVITDLDPSAITVNAGSNNAGNGGNIDFTQIGDIVVSGDRSTGVLAQSLGGGGGTIDRIFMDRSGGAGNAGTIDLNLDGNIMADGAQGIGVFAQSRAAGSQGDISMTLTADKRLSFGPDGTGVWISGGAANRFANYGTVAGEDCRLGWAVRGEEGDETVDNYSILLGQLDLGSGSNRFTNHVNKLFVPGPQLLLGNAANLLTQDGIMMPGDMHYAQRSDLTGSFRQSCTGLTFAELDFNSVDSNVDGGIIDRIYATGTVDLKGEIDVSLLNPQLVPYGRFEKTIFHGDLGVTDSGMFLTTAPSVVITYELTYPTGCDAKLDYNVDFSPECMSKNLNAVGDYFNRIQAVGSSPAMADTVIKLLYDPGMETYKNSLSQMSPEFYGELQAEVIHSSQRFSQIIAEGGAYRFVKNDHLIWLDLKTEKNTHDPKGDFKDAKHYADRCAMGLEKTFNDKWAFGLGVAVDDIDSNSYDCCWTSDGDSRHVGVSAKRNSGDTQLALTAAYGWGFSKVKRIGQVTDPFVAESIRDLETFGAMLRVSHQINPDPVYLRPGFDLGVTRLEADNAVETGAGAISLELDDYGETHIWIRPSLRIGTHHDFTNGTKLQMYADLGVQFYLSDPETEVVAGFTGAPAAADPIQSYVDLGGSYGEITIGAQIVSYKDASLGLEYSTIADNHYTLDRWSLRLNIPF